MASALGELSDPVGEAWPRQVRLVTCQVWVFREWQAQGAGPGGPWMAEQGEGRWRRGEGGWGWGRGALPLGKLRGAQCKARSKSSVNMGQVA